MNDQFISKEMVDSAMVEMRGDGVRQWCDKYIGEMTDVDNEPIEAFENFYTHVLKMVILGADPITTATASFITGFEVARRFFNNDEDEGERPGARGYMS